MTWFKVDDSFHAHPKVLATDPAALGLWVVAGAWSSAHLTEGFVPDHALPRLLPDSAELALKLVAAGLWRRVRGGYQFHDWTDYNPTADAVRILRERRAEAGRKGGLARSNGARRDLNVTSKRLRAKPEERLSSRPTNGRIDPQTDPQTDHKPATTSATTPSKPSSKSQAHAEALAKHDVDESLNPRPVPPPSQREGGTGGAPALTRGRSAPPAADDPPPVRPIARPPDLTGLRAQLRGTAALYRAADRQPPALPSTPAATATPSETP